MKTIDNLSRLNRLNSNETKKEVVKDSLIKKRDLASKNNKNVFIDERWLTTEDVVKSILDDFFLNEKEDIVKVIKSKLHLNNNKDPYSESDFIIKNLKNKDGISLFKDCFNNIEEYSKSLYNSMARSMIYNNTDYIIDLLYPNKKLGVVIRRALKKSIKMLNIIGMSSKYIIEFLDNVIYEAESFGCDLDYVDEKLKKSKKIITPEEAWIVGSSYTYLSDAEDLSERNWRLHGKEKGYAKYYISFETSEVRGLNFMAS